MAAVSSRELKLLTRLKTKKGRQEERRFLCEGVRLLEEALEARYYPDLLLYSPIDLNDRGRQLIARARGEGVTVREISSRECRKLVGTQTSQGIAAVMPGKQYCIEEVLSSGVDRILVCDRINDPGNLGTLFRSALAFDFGALLLNVGTVEVTNAKVLRAGMGACFHLPYAEGIPDDVLVAMLVRNGYALWVADIQGTDIRRLDVIPGKVALVIGSETAGIGRRLAGQAAMRLTIPMSGRTESLNAAMAGTVIMFWIQYLREGR